MKRLFLALGFLVLGFSFCEAVQKYKITTSTKMPDVGYTIKGSQKYEICADTASTPIITLSSSTASFGGLLLQNATAQNTLEFNGNTTSFFAVKSVVDQIRIDTGTLLTNKLAKIDSFSGDVSGTYDDLEVDKVKGIDMSTGLWGINEYLIHKGTFVATSIAGLGDMTTNTEQIVTAGKYWTGQSTATEKWTFSDFNSSDDSMWKVIYSSEGVTAVSSFTITGLNGNIDKEYMIEMRGTNASNDIIQIVFNGDLTETNYTTMLSGITNVNYPIIGFFYSVSGYFNCRISARTGTVRTWNSLTSMSTSLTAMSDARFYGGLWSNTTDNITSITIYTDSLTTMNVYDVTIWARR